MSENGIVDQANRLILYVSRTVPFRSGLDRHLIRAAMVFTFFAFSIQKWNQYTIEMLVPMISHSPVVFWLLPVFGVRGAGYFLATTETIFGALIFLGYWSPRLGRAWIDRNLHRHHDHYSLPAGCLGSGGGRISDHALPLGFLMKDVLFLAASFYLLKQDVARAAMDIQRS
jgi:uncharacterized membrane protein YkgB